MRRGRTQVVVLATIALAGVALSTDDRQRAPAPSLRTSLAARPPRAPMPVPRITSPLSSFGPTEREAVTIDYPVLAENMSFPTFDARGRERGRKAWRVVPGTGNCCENYLATDPNGRIYDFGSTYLVYSDNEGKSWKQVRPDPTVAASGGEGSIVLAPNGDVIGVTWIPYGGDRVETFKYDAGAEKWFYSYAALHHPFYDRESVAVIPGPIEHLGETYPYMAVMRGGWPSKNPWFYSFDGLTYFRPNHRLVDSMTRPEVARWLDVKRDPALDWIQPAMQTTVTPLGRGLALAKPDGYRGGSERFDIFDRSDLGWSPFKLPRGELESGLDTKLVADSTGRLHYVYMTRTKAVYKISADGGRRWRKHVIPMPFKGARTWSTHGVQEEYELFEPSPRFEMVVNGKLGITALSMQIHDPKKNLHISYVYKYALRGARARLQAIHQLGAGDLEFGDDVTASGARMDFQSVALLPDGRIVASFGDKMRSSPAVAIEL